MKAILLIDIQIDFLSGGALAVEHGDEIVPVANRLMPQYELAVATQDWHPADHSSFASQHPDKNVGDIIQLDGVDQTLWPDHCVQGTHGAEFSKKLNTEGIHQIILKGTNPAIDSYSGFFDNARRKATGLDVYLRGQNVNQVHVMGLATDYCVKYTVMDALDLNYQVILLSEGVRGVNLNERDCQRAIEEMRLGGAEIR